MILHLFKNDLRRSRTLLIAWGLLVLVQSLLVGWSVHPGDHALQAIYLTISKMVPLFQALLLIVIVPHLVQEEPLVGTTAFWFTRPIPRPSLLKAKALFAAVLIALPLVAETCVLATNGITAHDIALAAPEIVLKQLSLIVVVATLAALTPSFGRFAIVGAVFVVASMVASLGIVWAVLLRHPGGLAALADDYTLLKSRTIANGVLVAACGGAILVHQYLTRKTRSSAISAILVAAASVVLTAYWPFDFFPKQPTGGTGEKFDPASIKVSLTQTMPRDLGSIRGLGTQEKSLAADIDTSGLPAGDIAIPSRVDPHLALPDGSSLQVHEVTSTPGAYGQPDPGALEHALGGIPIVNGANDPGVMVGLLRLDDETFRKYADEPVKLTADMDMTVSKYVIVAEMPVAAGSRYDRGSEHEIVTDVLREGTGVEVLVEKRNVQLLFDGASKPANLAFQPFQNGQTVYLLCNRKRHMAVLQKQGFNVDLSSMLLSSGERLIHQTLQFSFGPEQYRLTPDLTEAWLADATLVRLQLEPVGSVSKQLVVEKFLLGGANRPPGRPVATADYDPAVFSNIVLPEHAAKAQVREYIDALLAVSQRNAHNGALLEKLKKVGHENIDVLLEAEDTVSPGLYTPALDSAIQELAQRDDEKLVLDALATHPSLIDAVVRYNWSKDAHDTLIAALKDSRQRALPRSWIRAIAEFKEPATYPDLKAYLVRARRRQEVFNAIRKLPGIDLRDSVDRAWDEAKIGGSSEIVDASDFAADYGHLDALEEVVKTLKSDSASVAQIRRAQVSVRRLLPVTGDDDAIIAWFDANRDRLAFDPRVRKYIPRPQ